MSKSPNTDNKKKKSSCWGCENYQGSGRKCDCGERSRAVDKRQAEQDIQDDLATD